MMHPNFSDGGGGKNWWNIVRLKPIYFQIPGYSVSSKNPLVDEKEYKWPAANHTRILLSDSNIFIQVKPG